MDGVSGSRECEQFDKIEGLGGNVLLPEHRILRKGRNVLLVQWGKINSANRGHVWACGRGIGCCCCCFSLYIRIYLINR